MVDFIEFYYQEKNNIDICLGFLSGCVLSFFTIKYKYQIKVPIWVSQENITYENSHILEILYQDFKKSGDSDYELYDETIHFNENNVKIGDEVVYFRHA